MNIENLQEEMIVRINSKIGYIYNIREDYKYTDRYGNTEINTTITTKYYNKQLKTTITKNTKITELTNVYKKDDKIIGLINRGVYIPQKYINKLIPVYR